VVVVELVALVVTVVVVELMVLVVIVVIVVIELLLVAIVVVVAVLLLIREIPYAAIAIDINTHIPRRIRAVTYASEHLVLHLPTRFFAFYKRNQE
jgi:hypothetical protein